MLLGSTILGLSLPTWLFAGLVLSVVGLLITLCVWLVQPLLGPRPLSLSHPQEQEYTDFDLSLSGSAGRGFFPSLRDEASVFLSVIVPAYNEEERLPVMLDECLPFLRSRFERDSRLSFEVIVVNDGSRDRTAAVVLEYTKRYGADSVRLLDLHCNHGKGGAVCKGMLRARGQYLLMADADGATAFADLERLEAGLAKVVSAKGQPQLGNGARLLGIAVGSRAHLVETDAVARRNGLRTFLMHAFHLVVRVLAVKDVQDTQCGFKLFTRAAAQRIFPNQHIQRWAFDCELLYLASHFGIPVREEAVNWTEIEGSKLSVGSASLQMLRDLVLIRLCYMFGVWKVYNESGTQAATGGPEPVGRVVSAKKRN